MRTGCIFFGGRWKLLMEEPEESENSDLSVCCAGCRWREEEEELAWGNGAPPWDTRSLGAREAPPLSRDGPFSVAWWHRGLRQLDGLCVLSSGVEVSRAFLLCVASRVWCARFTSFRLLYNTFALCFNLLNSISFFFICYIFFLVFKKANKTSGDENFALPSVSVCFVILSWSVSTFYREFPYYYYFFSI